MREIDEDVWAKYIINKTKDKEYCIIDDLRFQNELNYLNDWIIISLTTPYETRINRIKGIYLKFIDWLLIKYKHVIPNKIIDKISWFYRASFKLSLYLSRPLRSSEFDILSAAYENRESESCRAPTALISTPAALEISTTRYILQNKKRVDKIYFRKRKNTFVLRKK